MAKSNAIPFYILGAVILIALRLVVPIPVEWRHTVGMVIIAAAVGPWMLVRARRPWAYLAFAASTIGIMAAIETAF